MNGEVTHTLLIAAVVLLPAAVVCAVPITVVAGARGGVRVAVRWIFATVVLAIGGMAAATAIGALGMFSWTMPA